MQKAFRNKKVWRLEVWIKVLEIGERYMKAQANNMHKLYTVKREKKHNCCQSMQSLQECCMGPSLSEQRKHSQTPFPQCYHIRTSLVGKFLIYAVIQFFLLWYRRGFNIQMPFDPETYPQISPLFPVGLQPSASQQIVLTRCKGYVDR